MSRDHHLQEAVLAALAWEPDVDAGHIGLTADNGVVTLTGHVASLAAKRAAEAAACGVRGVKAVAEELEVRLPSEVISDDAQICAAAIDRLAWNTSVPKDAVKIRVEKGWVTLEGELDWHYQRQAAEADIRQLAGVTGLSNLIVIKPPVKASNISDDILHALHRSWFFDTKTIDVTVENGRVHLTGTVTSPHDRQTAAATAWSAPGVVDVINDIEVL